jgi:hypothetical protein
VLLNGLVSFPNVDTLTRGWRIKSDPWVCKVVRIVLGPDGLKLQAVDDLGIAAVLGSVALVGSNRGSLGEIITGIRLAEARRAKAAPAVGQSAGL